MPYQESWLLVSGAPRSGTTFLQQLLNTHPRIACLHEYGFDRLIENTDRSFVFEQHLRNEFDEGAASLGEAGSLHEFSEKRYNIAKDISGDAFPTPRRERHAENLWKAFFDVVSGKPDLLVRGDKTPNLAFYQSTASRIRTSLGGRIKQIYIVRHPLGVIRSSMRRAHMTSLGLDVWRIQSLYAAMAEWRDNWEYVVDQFKGDHDDIHLIKYEDLLGNFRGETAKLADFLGIKDEFEDIAAAVPDHLVDFRLTQEQVAEVEAQFGPLCTLWNNLPLTEHMIRHPRIFFSLGGDTDLPLGNNPRSFMVLRDGFCDQNEPFGTWTVDQNAEIRFRSDHIKPGDDIQILLDYKPYIAKGRDFAFSASVNGGKPQNHHVTIWRKRPRITITATLFGKAIEGDVSVKLFFPKVKKPHEAPAGDIRPLGMGLRRIRIVPGGKPPRRFGLRRRAS